MAARTFELQWDKYALGFRFFLSLGFFVFGILILFPSIYSDNTDRSTYDIILGSLYVLPSLLSFPLFISRLSDKYPPLALSEEGITYHVTSYKELFISWHNIEDIEWASWENNFFSKGTIDLLLVDPRAFNEKQSGVVRFFRRLFRSSKVTIQFGYVTL